MADWNSGPTYTLGPISAAEGSPLGGLLAFASQASSNYARGNAIETGSPATAVAYFTGNPSLTQDQLDSAYQAGIAAQANMSGPANVANAVGNVFGAGVTTIGNAAGVTGKAASAGVSAGTSQATTGAVSVGSSAVTGALSGILPGLSSGVTSSLSGISAATGTTGSETMLLVLGGLMLVALLIML
jgi:hypothetical protein